jgi:hypothetical protein
MPEVQGPVSKRQLGPVSHEGKWLLLRKSAFLIEFLQLLHAAKGDAAKDNFNPSLSSKPGGEADAPGDIVPSDGLWSPTGDW